MKGKYFALGFLLSTLLTHGQSTPTNSLVAISSDGAVYDIQKFGAVGDDQTINTRAIQDAIDACTGSGGGTVLVPQGRFRTGTLQLKDNVILHFSPGACLVGSTNHGDYLDRNE